MQPDMRRPAGAPAPRPNVAAEKKKRRKLHRWLIEEIKISTFIVTVGGALIILSLLLWIWTASGYNEYSQVNTKGYQAVFINGVTTTSGYSGSLYFGKVKRINREYFVLQDVYFLNPSAQTSSKTTNASSNLELTKLGCQQLHDPYDEIVINRSSVAFWENIQDTGKVVQAIKQYQKQNPNGPNCSVSTPSSTTTVGQ